MKSLEYIKLLKDDSYKEESQNYDWVEDFEEQYGITLKEIKEIIARNKDIAADDFRFDVEGFQFKDIIRFYNEYKLFMLTPIEVAVLIRLHSEACFCSWGMFCWDCFDNDKTDNIQNLYKRGVV